MKKNEKNTVCKYLLGLIFGIVMLTIPNSVSVSANGVSDAIQRLVTVYPNSCSYFTSDGKIDSNNDDSRCSLINIPARGGLPSGQTVKNSYGKSCWSCHAFAEYAWYVIYGHCTNTQVKTISTSELRIGDFIRFTGHSAIYLGEDSQYYYVYDSNWASSTDNKVRYNHTIKKTRGIEYCYRATNYNEIANVTPEPENPYYNSYGFDNPSNNDVISDGTFLFQGWIDAKKEISSITCSINHGARYVGTDLYTRPDVSYATAFRTEIDSNILNLGTNDIALCVNFTDGSATVVENRTVTWSPKLLWGYDSPTEDMQISDNQFQFSGWIETGKKLKRVSCSLNHGEQYLTANLYKRPDVPNATAFRLDIGSSNLHYGENNIAVCAYYADGTGETIAERKVRKCIDDAIEYPQDDEKFTCKNAWFLLQGWSTDDTRQIDHFEFIINDTRYTTVAHTRADLAGNARYYREQVPIDRLKNGKNKIEIFAYYSDGTSRNIGQREVIGDIEHTWDSGKVTQEASCIKTGIRTYTCTTCQTTKTEEIPATGKHENTEVRNAKEATCAEEGYTGDTYCKDCGTKLSAGEKIAKKAHTWDSGKVTQEAICTKTGTKTYTCTTCQTTKTEEIPATGHVNKITKFAKEATCKSEGYTGDIYCKDCGKLLEEGDILPKEEHVWDEGKITQQPGCAKSGERTYTCTTCQTTKTEEIPATGHLNKVTKFAKKATCKTEGYTGDIYCQDCGELLEEGNALAQEAHIWDEGKITKQPTSSAAGVRTYTCKNCGTTKTESIAKLQPKKLTPGKVIKDKATNGVYKVLKDGVTVEFAKTVSRKTSVKIPDTVKLSGITCKVTEISANAFKNDTTLRTVTIGKNVTIIGSNAFYGARKLSKVSGGSAISKIGDKAFYNCSGLTGIELSKTVKYIGRQAFYNCKNLKTIIVKTSQLTSKNVGTKAFTGIYTKPIVKVPANKFKAYQKLLKSKGMSTKAIYKK